jgi:hypothetical protein
MQPAKPIMDFMEKVVRIFNSHAEADEADALSDAQLSPDERIRITIELRDRRHPDAAQHTVSPLRAQPRSEVFTPLSHSCSIRCPISANSGCSFM